MRLREYKPYTSWLYAWKDVVELWVFAQTADNSKISLFVLLNFDNFIEVHVHVLLFHQQHILDSVSPN